MDIIASSAVVLRNIAAVTVNRYHSRTLTPRTMRHSLRKSISLLLIGFPIMLACSDSTSPDETTIAGNYAATIFTTTPTGGSARNELQAGSTVVLTLNSTGTTSGHLHVAANGAVPAFDADLAGTWVVNNNVVTFTQTADTFFRNMAFTVLRTGSQVLLVGDQVFSGTRVNLTLSRS